MLDSRALVFRHAWDAARNHEVEFAVYSHGIAERMPKGLVRQTAHVDDWLFIYFHEAAVVARGGRRTEVSAGQIVVWELGEAREYGRDDREWTHSWLQFAGKRARATLASVGLGNGGPWSAGGREPVERGLRALHEELTTPERPSPRILGNLFENWLLRLRRGQAEAQTGGVEGRLRRLKARLDTELAGPVSLSEMAQWAGMSISHLGALFRERYGAAPVTYHIERRMDLARYLLATRALSVASVGEAVGYPEPADFSRIFKRVVGVGPRAYRSRSGNG